MLNRGAVIVRPKKPRATSSLPDPVSPVTSTGQSTRPTRAMASSNRFMAGDAPTSHDKRSTMDRNSDLEEKT